MIQARDIEEMEAILNRIDDYHSVVKLAHEAIAATNADWFTSSRSKLARDEVFKALNLLIESLDADADGYFHQFSEAEVKEYIAATK